MYFNNNKKSSHKGTIILRNGISSSGKSAILEVLRKQLQDYVIFKVDDYFRSRVIKTTYAIYKSTKSRKY